jgi:hypothetical protein
MFDQRLQIRTRECPFGSELVAVDSPQPMFVDPVAHSRFVQVKTSSDLCQREASGQ